MTSERRQNRIIFWFILLSMLLHLLLLLVPKHRLLPEEVPPAPVYVEVRPQQQRDRELDLPPPKEQEKPRERPAKRLAEKDQTVPRETAPEGRDTEDREKVVRSPKPVSRPVPPQQAQPEPAQETRRRETAPSPVTPEGWQSREEQRPLAELPDLQALTQISPSTLARIESDWRRKYREDVAKGDTVWMDTEQDLLISFMRRFRDNIYNVWNYPSEAAARQQQGTCLLRITVDRQGNVTDVVLLETSGASILDDEAVRAVRKGASYGPLPRAYPNEYLNIMAFFQYHMNSASRRSYRPRPGQIY